MLGRAAFEQLLAVEAVFADLVIRVIDQEQLVALGHVHAVGAIRELALAPGVKEVTVAVVDHHRVVATAKQVDIALRVGADAGDVGVLVARWKPLPTLDELVLQRSAANLERF